MNWPEFKLKDLGEIVTGSTPSISNENFYGGEIPFVTPSELDFHESILRTPRTLTQAGADVSRVIPEGSVMVCCIGSLGKIGYAGRSLVTNQQINSIIFDNKKVNKKYGFYACKRLKNKLVSIAPATTVPIVNKTRFSELTIPLPPLEQQQRIVAILDKAELVKRKRELAIERLDTLAQSIYRRNFGNSPSIKLEEICSFQNGGTPSKEVSEYWEGDIPWISSADIVGSKIQYGRNFITTLGVNNSATNIAPKGTILIVTRTGVGKVAITDRPTAFSQDIVSITLKKGFDINFVCEALKNNLPYFLSHARGATIQGITRSVLASALIPKVDEGGQNIFGKIISAINEKNHLFIKSLGDINSLGASLQSKAFSGQL